MQRYSVTAGEHDYEVPPAKQGRSGSFAGSVILHALAGVVLAIWPELDNEGLLRSHEKELREELKNSKKITLYYPRVQRLPDVSPKAARRVTQEAKSKPDDQMIRTQSRRRALNVDQFIRVPVPRVRQQQLPSPNIVVVQQAPAPPPPPPAPAPVPRKTFAPPAPTKPAVARATSAGLVAAVENAPQQPTILTEAAGAVNVPTARSFLPPPPVAGSGKQSSRSVEITDAAPNVTAGQGTPGGNSTSPTTIIISSMPVPGAPPPKPEGNRNARIALGGESGTGNNRASAPAGGVTAPGVTIRSTAPPGGGAGVEGVKPPPPPPKAAPAAVEARVAPARFTPGISVPMRPNTRRVPPQVEALFQNRVVYSTAVPTAPTQPDWVVWFGDTAPPASAYERVVMRPPVPEPGTLPTVLPGMPAKAWIQAKLRRNGVLTEITLLNGASAPPQAVAELGKWMFYPAVRNGQPADVEVLLEVTWRP